MFSHKFNFFLLLVQEFECGIELNCFVQVELERLRLLCERIIKREKVKVSTYELR